MEKIHDPFEKDLETYERFDFDFDKSYIAQMSSYLSLTRKISIEEAEKLVRRALSETDLKDPVVNFFYRDRETLDRKRIALPMSKYLTSVKKKKEIMAPSLTTYVNKELQVSVHAEIVAIKAVNRGKLKKKAFAAKQVGDNAGFTINNIGQTNEKLDSNSISGIYITLGSILYNPSNHSSLTSNTRVVTSIANAMFERLISGNRNYQNVNIAINDVIALIEDIDEEAIMSTLSKYGLQVPSHKYVFKTIMDSLTLYTVTDHSDEIANLVKNMNDAQRAIYIYTGDLHSLIELNSPFFKDLFKGMLKYEYREIDNALEIVKGLSDYDISLVSNILFSKLKGKGKNYDKFDKELLNHIASCATSVNGFMTYIDNMVNTFFKSDIIPAGVPYVRDMARKAVIMSDTDSTTPCMQEIVKWYKNDYKVDDEAYGVAGIIMYIGELYLKHLLAIYTTHSGVSIEDIPKVAMKSEFSFNAMVTLSISKHYYSLISMQEGNVFKKFDQEIKGVNLKNSALPAFVTKEAKELMIYILTKANDGELIDPKKLVNKVISIENTLLEAVKKGDANYLKRIVIKDIESYSNKDPYKSNYRYLNRWKEIFGNKYNFKAEVPCSMVKLTTTLVNKTAFNQWLADFPDDTRDIAQSYFRKEGISLMKKAYIPEDFLAANKLPAEFDQVIDYDLIVRDLCNIFYIILSGVSIYKSKNFTFTEWTKE